MGKIATNPDEFFVPLCRSSITTRMVVSELKTIFDGANLYAASKSLGFDIDFKRLLREYESRGTLLRALYYTTIIEDQEFSAIRPLIDWLDYNGYTVVSKPAKEFDDGEGRRKVKRNMSIELVVDALELSNHIDRMVLFSGDGDFPLAGRSSAAARRPRYGGLDPIDDCRRAAAPG